METITFKKGIYTIYIPFMLSEFSPWEEQVKNEISKCQKRYKVRKSARWGFEITETGAHIKVYKN